MGNKIPSASNINRPTPRGARGGGSVNISQTPNIFGSANIRAHKEGGGVAAAVIGDTLAKVGTDIEKKQERERIEQERIADAYNKQEIAMAKSLWTKKRIEIEKGFIGDTDPITLPERQRAALDEGRDQVLSNVGSETNKSALGLDFEVDIDQEGLRSSRIARERVNSNNLASINQQIDDNNSLVLEARTPEERQELINANKALVQSRLAYGATPVQIQEGMNAQDRALKTLEYNTMQDDINRVISEDPARALFELENGLMGTQLKDKDLAAAKKSASSTFDKHDEKMEKDALVAEINESRSTYDKFDTGRIDGTFTLADAERYGEEKGKDSHLYKYMVDELTVPESKLPKPPMAERQKAWNNLFEQYTSLGIKEGEVTNGDIKQLGDVQDLADKYLADRLITKTEYNKVFKTMLSAELNMVNNDSLGFEEETNWLWGHSNPYNRGMESINAKLKKEKRENDILYKRDLVSNFVQQINGGDGYKSTNTNDGDEKLIDDALRRTYDLTASSNVRAKDGTPNSVINKVGKAHVTTEKSDMKSDAAITTNFKTKTLDNSDKYKKTPWGDIRGKTVKYNSVGKMIGFID